MRTCVHCQHTFDERTQSPANCPACGRAFTVSDIGAMTLELPTPVSQSAGTVSDPPSQPAGASPAPPADDPQKTLVTDIGQTIQSGRWSPSAAELADAGGAGSVQQTIDSSFLSADVPVVRDVTQMWDSSHFFSEGSIQVPLPGVPGSVAGIGSAGGAAPAAGSVPSGSAKSGPGPAGSTPSGSASSAKAPSSKAPSGKAPSGKAPSGKAPSGGASPAPAKSLEQSLVIQPRVLRPDEPAGDPSADPTAERTDFNLLKKLGEGGMGVVFAARQQSIRRVVALKMLKGSTDQNAAQREKFLAEAVITGELEHPNIVPIYDLGRDEAGAIFYAMKHVQGTPWDALLGKKSLHENLDILMKVADAVAFAHSKQIIHRDLKPENVMLGEYGEVLVMDWGLALSLDSPPAAIAMGGTPAYMAPEMAMGPLDLLGPGSDVYLLGAILYEIVTGQRPHGGTTVTRCLMSAARNEIVPTQKTGELIDIARRAMATHPKDRYAGVREFQDAIRLYQSHTESIALAQRAQEDLAQARQSDQYDIYARALFGFQEAVNLWEGNARARSGVAEAALAYAGSAQRKGDFDLGLSLLDAKDVQHQPLIGELRLAQRERESRQQRLRAARRIGIGLVAAIFVIVTGAFFWIRAEANRARQAEVVAKTEKAEAVRQKGVAEAQRKIALDEQAKAVAAQKEEERQRKIAVDEQAKAIKAQQEAERQRMIAVDEQTKAVAAQKEEERQRKLADEARQKEEYEGYVAKIGLAAAKVEENAFDHALALINECPAGLRDWEWGRLRYLCSRDVKSFDCGQPLETVAVSADGQRLAAGGWGGQVRIFEIESGKELVAIPTGATYVFALAFSPDGQQLAAGTNAKPSFVSVWNAESGKLVRGLEGHGDAVLSVAWSRDGQQLLTGSYDSTARLWNLATGKSQEFRGHDWWVWSAAFSPDESRIVTASQDGSAIVWTVATGAAGPPFLGHRGPVYSAAFSPDGELIATSSYDKRVLVWRPSDLRSQDLAKALSGDATSAPPTPSIALEGHTASVRSVRFSSDGRLLVSGGNDNAICVWDVANHSLVKKLRGHASRVSAAVFAPGDDRVLSAGYDHFARLWSISKYEEVRVLGGRVLKGHRDSILGAAFSPNGQTVVTASRDRSAIAWDVASGQPLRSYTEGHAYLASTALFFPDEKRVLTSAVDGTTRIWDVTTGTQLAALEGTGTTAAVALSRSGQWLVTGSSEQALLKWDAAGKRLDKFEGFHSEITALAISPDDQWIFCGDGVGRCRLLRADTGAVVWESRSHSRGITAVAFVAGGQRVLSASLDNTVAQWDVSTGQETAARLFKHPDAVTSLAVSSDGRLALTACADKQVRLWDVERAAILKTLPSGDAATTDVAIHPAGKRGLTITADNRLHLFDLDAGAEISPAGEKQGAFLDLSAATLLIWSAAWSGDGERLLTVGGAEAHLWDAASAQPLMAFSPQSAVSSVQFSKTGEQLVTGSWDNAARIWNTASGSALVKLGGVHTRFVNASVFSPDGTKVLTASDDKTVRLWDAVSGKLLGSFIGHEGRVLDVAFSAKGQWVLTASDDKTARIWDAATGQVLHVLQGHSQAVLCAEFSADDRLVITGSDDTTARLWDAATGQAQPMVLAGHTASVTAAAFTPDGKRALTGSKDITAKVWDPAKGTEILTLTGHSQEITTVAVSPDGRSLLTGSRDGTAIVWLSAPWREDPPVALLTSPLNP